MGQWGVVYKDMRKFEAIYPEANDIFKKRLNQLRNYGQRRDNDVPLQSNV